MGVESPLLRRWNKFWKKPLENQRKDKLENMKLLHTGDLHLDSPFSSTKATDGAEASRRLRKTFSDIVSYVRENKYDMLLIAGDLFDGAFVTRETAAHITSQLENAGCPVVIAPGNHDPFDMSSIWKKKEFPRNVYIFKSEELAYFDFEELGVRVYGAAFNSANMRTCPLDGCSIDDKSRINILLCHGDTASPMSQKCPMPPSAIAEFGADYTALGHIHNPGSANEALRAKGVMAAYCGCPMGRDFGECGVKGALSVEITKDGERTQVKSEFVPFSDKIYEDCELKVDGAETMADIISEIRTLIREKGYGEDTILRIKLTGYTAPGLAVVTEEAESQCRESVCSLTVVDKTVPALSGDELESDRGIKGEVYRALLPAIENGTPEERDNAVSALRYALAALGGENI